MSSEILLSDEAIVVKILAGETHLYEKLMRKFNQRLYRISMSIINDDKAAEDIMQTAYINAYRQLGNFRNEAGFSTWLTRILINESLLRKKRKQKLEKVLTESARQHINQNNNPLAQLMNKELRLILEWKSLS